MAFSTPLAHTAKTGALTTDAINTTGANLIVIVVASDNGTTPTDNKGNTFLLCNDRVQGFSELAMFYLYNPAVGSGHTFSQTQTYGAIFVAAFSGAIITPLDLDLDNVTASGTSLATGSGTPSQNNELVVMGINIGGSNSTHSVNGGFTLLDHIDGVNGVNYGGGLAYLIQTAAASVNPTYSWTTANEAAIGLNSFKATVGGNFFPFFYP